MYRRRGGGGGLRPILERYGVAIHAHTPIFQGQLIEKIDVKKLICSGAKKVFLKMAKKVGEC